MSVKMFVTDLDGTLLPSGKEVSAENIEAVKKMDAAGITVTIATGRMYRAALPVAQALEVNVPIITYNGALIKSVDGEVIHGEYLPENLIVELVNFFEERNWYLQSYSGDVLHIPARDKYAVSYETAQEVEGMVVGWDGLKKFTKESCKVLSITDGAEDTDIRVKAVNEKFSGRVSAFKSNANYAEIVLPGVSKAAAIKILADKLKIEKSEIMAIGDSENDLPMLKAAGKSIAMGNAVEEVKNVCDFVTGNCEADGFAEAVYKYVL